MLPKLYAIIIKKILTHTKITLTFKVKVYTNYGFFLINAIKFKFLKNVISLLNINILNSLTTVIKYHSINSYKLAKK